MADISGPYIPIFGDVVVPFPAQWRRISKALSVTFAVELW